MLNIIAAVPAVATQCMTYLNEHAGVFHPKTLFGDVPVEPRQNNMSLCAGGEFHRCQILFFVAEHKHTSKHTCTCTQPPLPPPACAILPTAALGKIIRWPADMLSIFLSWLSVRLAGRLFTERCVDRMPPSSSSSSPSPPFSPSSSFFFSAPAHQRARRGERAGDERRPR